MRRNLLFLICPFVFLALQENVWAPEEFIKSVVRNVVQGTEIDDIDEPF
jgi:hypothetical protein